MKRHALKRQIPVPPTSLATLRINVFLVGVFHRTDLARDVLLHVQPATARHNVVAATAQNVDVLCIPHLDQIRRVVRLLQEVGRPRSDAARLAVVAVKRVAYY